MRFALCTLAAAALSLSACASSQPVLGAGAPAVALDVVPSAELAFRANNQSEDATFSQRRGSGFAGGGFLGEDAVAYLVEQTERELRDDLAEEGFRVDSNAPTTLRVVIQDARNNRPTYRQLSEDPSLDFSSFGTGGAELVATLSGAGAQGFGTVEYRRFDTLDPTGFAQANGTWTDATRAISQFSRRAAEALARSVPRG